MATVDVSARLQNFDEQYIPFPPFVAAMNAIEANLQMFREARVATHMLVTGDDAVPDAPYRNRFDVFSCSDLAAGFQGCVKHGFSSLHAKH